MSRRELSKIIDRMLDVDYESEELDEELEAINDMVLNYYKNTYVSRYNSFRNDWHSYVNGWN